MYLLSVYIICIFLRIINKNLYLHPKLNRRGLTLRFEKASAAGVLIAFGIIFGDIGTSPLYVFNAITKGREITEALIIGSLSCILWTITLQTTIKYVWLVLKADNKGEGAHLHYMHWFGVEKMACSTCYDRWCGIAR